MRPHTLLLKLKSSCSGVNPEPAVQKSVRTRGSGIDPSGSDLAWGPRVLSRRGERRGVEGVSMGHSLAGLFLLWGLPVIFLQGRSIVPILILKSVFCFCTVINWRMVQ